MKICPTCNKEFPDDQKFCKYDGTPLAEKKAEAEAGKKCPKCGRTYPTDAGFCMTCGAKRGVEEGESSSPEAPTT